MVKNKTIKEPGKKPITFKPGGLHATLGLTPGKKIPAAMMKAALAGKHGPKAKKQALFHKNVLTGPKKRKKAAKLLIKKGGRVSATKEMQKRMGFY